MGRPLGGTAAGQARGAVGRPLRGWPAERWEDRWMLLGVFSRATAAAQSSRGQRGQLLRLQLSQLLHLVRNASSVSVHTIQNPRCHIWRRIYSEQQNYRNSNSSRQRRHIIFPSCFSCICPPIAFDVRGRFSTRPFIAIIFGSFATVHVMSSAQMK